MTSAVAELPDLGQHAPAAGRTVLAVRPAPPREPPFDDELGEDVAACPYDRPLPFARAAQRAPADPRPAPPPGLPDPALWGRRLLTGVIETAAGRRPLNQLTPLLSRSVAQGLRGDLERAARRGRPHWIHAAGVRSVRAGRPADGVAELAATVHAGPRVRAVALRLEVRHGRWCCTRLMLG